jgi:histidine ammonia-lyase
MVVRAQVFARGCSGVDPALLDLLAALLNRGMHPVVREVGGVGASGDLVELAQVALALIGEGDFQWRGATVSAREAMREAGIEPLVPRFREGLALMNGTSFHTGAAAVLLARARRIGGAAEVAGALAFEALGGHLEALAPELHAARPHAGQRAVAARPR